MPNPRASLVLALVLPLLTTGCVKSRLMERLGFAEQEVAHKRRSLESAIDRPEKRLTWRHACKLMEANNSQLKQARERQRDFKRQRRRFALDLINPRLSAIANLSSALGELSGIDDRDYGIRLFANFSVPNPLTAYARRYSLELQYYMGELSLHELERRMKIRLYAEFLRHEAPPTDTNVLDQLGQSDGGIGDIMGALIAKEQADFYKLSRQKTNRVSLNNLLNTQGENWAPDLSTLPDISYADELDRLDPEKGFGRLALKQAAGQFEAALAAKWKIAVDDLPDFNTGVSMPTLYDSRLDGDGFDAEETRLFFTLNDAFDLTGRDAERARKADERFDLVKENLDSRMEREIHRLDGAKSQYRLILKERVALEFRLKWMKDNPPPEGSSDMVIERVRDIISLRQKLHKNNMRQRQLDLEFWMWDEESWKSPF